MNVLCPAFATWFLLIGSTTVTPQVPLTASRLTSHSKEKLTSDVAADERALGPLSSDAQRCGGGHSLLASINQAKFSQSLQCHGDRVQELKSERERERRPVF